MNTHDILLTIQCITVGVLFVEILIVFLRWKNSIHSYLFLACIASFISNLGYLFEMQAQSEEAYITALKISYAGRVWVAFAFFLFAARMCRIRIPRGIIYTLVLIHSLIYISIMTIGSNDLYYPDYEFVPDPVFPRFYHSNGTLHDLLMALNAAFVIIALVWIIKMYRKEQNRTSKQRLLMLLMAFGVQGASFILHLKGAFNLSEYYDLTMLGALFGTIFMLIGIFKFDLLGAREIARDFVIDRISEGIIAVDNEGRIQYYNEPVARLFPEFESFFAKKGASRDGSLHMDKSDLVENRTDGVGSKGEKGNPARVLTPYDIISNISDAVRSNETINLGGRVYTPEENELLYMGEKYGTLYALVDDTEHYQYMEELEKQKDIANSANEAKSRFLASMSHEIRTPINAVLGMDEMILRESGEKNIRAYATDIMSAGKTLLSLINDILDLSKVEEGKMEIIPVQYDLSSLINDLVNMTRPRADKKGLKFNIEIDENIPHILIGDEIRIRQCAMNILTNAVKYTETGEVTMKVGYREADKDRIFLKISVTDTGIGMKAEDMESLFSPYKRIEEKRNRAIEGTGLGMSITRQLLDLMGSSLPVQSEYGKGSEFSFEVEQEVVSREKIGDISERLNVISEQSHEYHELFHAPDAKILVVDDTEMNLTVIMSLLKKTGIQIDTAMSGRDALKLTQDNLYDAIFIDHMMPDMDGIETLEHIRESGLCTETPAVALTANAVSGARERYLEAGFNDYLSKPVDGEKLEKMLYNLIPDEKLIKPDESQADSRSVSDGSMKQVSGENGSGDSGNVPDRNPDSGSSDIPAWIYDLPDTDVEAGIKNCGSDEGYISVLTVFHQTAKTKADEIENLFNENDVENYTIKVHALKSSARIIGAGKMSKLAEELEAAGKSGDTQFIADNTGSLLDMYRTFDRHLEAFDTKKSDLPYIDAKALKEAYQTIVEIAQGMDYELMEGILSDLRTYNLPEADAKRVAAIERMLTELDWDGIIQEVGDAF